MNSLTREILDEEAEKYFSKLATKYDASDLFDTDEPIVSDITLRVLPEYPEWKKSLNGKKIPSYGGSKSMGWTMQDYIYEALGLAKYLIDNKYPQEAVLAMLPRDFSLKVAERLK